MRHKIASIKNIHRLLSFANFDRISDMIKDLRSESPKKWHKWNCLGHSTAMLQKVMTLALSNSLKLRNYGTLQVIMHEDIDGQKKWRLMCLAALLHDIGKPIARKIEDSTRNHVQYSLKEIDKFRDDLGLTDKQFFFLRTLVANHHVFDTGDIPKTDFIPESLILAYFDGDCTRGPKFYEKTESGEFLGEQQLSEKMTLIDRVLFRYTFSG